MENPAVRAETLWKKAPIQLMGSVHLSSTVPTAISAALTESTTLACMENLRQQKRFCTASRITRKPIPPKKINPLVTRLSMTLS